LAGKKAREQDKRTNMLSSWQHAGEFPDQVG